mgnify:CR=1 FL=1
MTASTSDEPPQQRRGSASPRSASLGRRDRVAPLREAAVPALGEREALTLEAVKLAQELGVDVNAANTDGRTALDAAQALKYETVVKFLVEQGAKPGVKK